MLANAAAIPLFVLTKKIPIVETIKSRQWTVRGNRTMPADVSVARFRCDASYPPRIITDITYALID